MINIYDDFFDKFWLDELGHVLMNEHTWHIKNVANRFSYPLNLSGSHRLIGMRIYHKKDNFNHSNEDLKIGLLNCFTNIKKRLKLNLELDSIDVNLQFKGMDGSWHIDGTKNQYSFILMLCNDIIDNFDKIGGQFIYKPTNKKINFRYGRLIQITASDEHRALSFKKDHIPRLTLKFVATDMDKK